MYKLSNAHYYQTNHYILNSELYLNILGTAILTIICTLNTGNYRVFLKLTVYNFVHSSYLLIMHFKIIPKRYILPYNDSMWTHKPPWALSNSDLLSNCIGSTVFSQAENLKFFKSSTIANFADSMAKRRPAIDNNEIKFQQ